MQDRNSERFVEASDTRTAFLANLRHELRTPLNAIIGYSEILLEDARDDGREEVILDLEKIHQGGATMLALVNDLLDGARIERDAANFDIREFAATVRYELGTPLNAILGYCEILLEDAEDQGDEQVAPDLQKIHSSAQRLLWLIDEIQKFSSLDAAPTSHQESGINLPTSVRDLMTSLRLLGDDSARDEPSNYGAILVVDDNELNRSLLSRRLERQGYTVTVAETGLQALDLCRGADFDLVLLDIMMPEVNGIQVLEILKSDPDRRHIPVIMISALDEFDSVIRCIEIGAEDYLLKPFNPVLLRARISACLEKKRLHDQRVEYLAQLARARELAEESERRALEANRAKSAFLANMSHELRTPLNAILGFVQLIDRDRTLNPEHQESLGIIMRSGEHLLGLINDVLSISEIESGRITLAPRRFDFRQFWQGLEEVFLLKAKKKGLQYTVQIAPEVPKFVVGDEGKLRQIVLNLLGNAFKFTTRGSIALNVEWTEGRVAVDVKDTGVGMSDEELGGLFQPFFQTESGRTINEGTGLGLAISRNLARLMGGDIFVKSVLGEGTTFRVEIDLPVADVADARTGATRVVGLQPDQPTFRILVVDEVAENRALLAKLLTSVGFDVRTAETGVVAVRLWAAWAPHMIWMDLRMPEMNGVEATREIRRLESAKLAADPHSPHLHHPPSRCAIVALTASAFDEDRDGFLHAGCDDFVPKPFREETIFEKIAKYLGAKFLYETPHRVDEPADETDVTRARIASLPEGLADKLGHAAYEGDIGEASKVIDEIQQYDAHLANGLRPFVKTFRLDEIADLAGKK